MTTRQQETDRWLEVQEDETVRVPQFDLPLSAALSSEAKALLSMALRKALRITIPSAFPPTLIITGTRAFDLSPALATHRALVQANVDASLHVFDGLGHCFYYDASTPESLDAYNTMIRFFRMRLSRA
jgi:acetyl esterase/lipase